MNCSTCGNSPICTIHRRVKKTIQKIDNELNAQFRIIIAIEAALAKECGFFKLIEEEGEKVNEFI